MTLVCGFLSVFSYSTNQSFGIHQVVTRYSEITLHVHSASRSKQELASLLPEALLKCIVMHIYGGGVMQYMHITCMGQINLSPAFLCVWSS